MAQFVFLVSSHTEELFFMCRTTAIQISIYSTHHFLSSHFIKVQDPMSCLSCTVQWPHYSVNFMAYVIENIVPTWQPVLKFSHFRMNRHTFQLSYLQMHYKKKTAYCAIIIIITTSYLETIHL